MFTLGIRAGKERIDRKDIKEKYRAFTTHFQALSKGTEELVIKVLKDNQVDLIEETYSTKTVK